MCSTEVETKVHVIPIRGEFGVLLMVQFALISYP